MPQVSKNKLSRIIQEELINSFNLVLSSISKREEMILFLSALLTDIEKLMLAKRLAIILLISENKTDSEIAQVLHVTRMTISKMRYFYESRGRKGYQIALVKIAGDKQLQSFKKLLLSLARYSIKASGGRI